MCIATSHHRNKPLPPLSLRLYAKHSLTNSPLSSSSTQKPVSPLSNDQAVQHPHHHPQQEPALLSTQENKHLIVHHDYNDHAHDLPPLDQQGLHHYSSTETAPFPIKLHDMLDRLQAEQQQGQDGSAHSNSTISWQPHGRCFIIHNPKDLVEQVLPRFFTKITKLASFQRQLNLYGFKRITQGLDKGAYYNEYFLRGKLFLAHRIERIRVKGTGVRAKSNPEEEPNLWDMEWVGVPLSPSLPKNSTAAALNKAMAAFSSGATTSFMVGSSTNNSTISDDSSSSNSSNTNTFPFPNTTTSFNLPQHKEKQEEVLDCHLITEWGRQFYAVHDLPINISYSHRSSSSPHEEEDNDNQALEKALLHDPFLTAMLDRSESDQDEPEISVEQSSELEQFQYMTPYNIYYHHDPYYHQKNDSMLAEALEYVADWSNDS